MLWRPKPTSRAYEIQYLRGQERVLDHLIAHEVGHLVRLSRVPEAERLLAAATPECRERAARQLIGELAEMLERGIPEAALPDLFLDWHQSLCGQVANFPADLRIEQWIHDRFSSLRAVQERSLTEEVQRAYPLLLPEIAQLTPPTIYFAQMAMNAAQAYHVGQLLRQPELLVPFTRLGLTQTGEHLTQLVFDAPDQGHCSDMAASNLWAREVNLSGWFEWQRYEEGR